MIHSDKPEKMMPAEHVAAADRSKLHEEAYGTKVIADSKRVEAGGGADRSVPPLSIDGLTASSNKTAKYDQNGNIVENKHIAYGPGDKLSSEDIHLAIHKDGSSFRRDIMHFPDGGSREVDLIVDRNGQRELDRDTITGRPFQWHDLKTDAYVQFEPKTGRPDAVSLPNPTLYGGGRHGRLDIAINPQSGKPSLTK